MTIATHIGSPLITPSHSPATSPATELKSLSLTASAVQEQSPKMNYSSSSTSTSLDNIQDSITGDLWTKLSQKENTETTGDLWTKLSQNENTEIQNNSNKDLRRHMSYAFVEFNRHGCYFYSDHKCIHVK